MEIMSIQVQFTPVQIELMQEIIQFGNATGFDFKSMTPETLDQLMKDWLEAGKNLHQHIDDDVFRAIKKMVMPDTFKGVAVGQTFCISRTGKQCKKLSETTAIGLHPTLGGFDFQEHLPPKEFKIEDDTRVYDVK